MNSKSCIYSILLFSIVVISFYYIVFNKQKEYFLIENVEIRKVNNHFSRDSLIIFIKFKKEYVSQKNSKRMLFEGSMEEGLNGLLNPNFDFRIFLRTGDTQINLNQNLVAKNIYNVSGIGDALEEVYAKGLSLTQIIEDLNRNGEYTTGNSLDGQDICFIFNSNSKNVNANLNHLESEIRTAKQIKKIPIKEIDSY